MTDLRPPSSITCPACGNTFACAPDGACWCMDEAFRLPMPDPSAAAQGDLYQGGLYQGGLYQGCLCPACLRRVAAERTAIAPKP